MNFFSNFSDENRQKFLSLTLRLVANATIAPLTVSILYPLESCALICYKDGFNAILKKIRSKQSSQFIYSGLKHSIFGGVIGLATYMGAYQATNELIQKESNLSPFAARCLAGASAGLIQGIAQSKYRYLQMKELFPLSNFTLSRTRAFYCAYNIWATVATCACLSENAIFMEKLALVSLAQVIITPFELISTKMILGNSASKFTYNEFLPALIMRAVRQPLRTTIQFTLANSCYNTIKNTISETNNSYI